MGFKIISNIQTGDKKWEINKQTTMNEEKTINWQLVTHIWFEYI